MLDQFAFDIVNHRLSQVEVQWVRRKAEKKYFGVILQGKFVSAPPSRARVNF